MTRFMTLAAVTATLLFVLAGLGNLAADPHDQYAHQWVPPRTTDFPAAKVDQWQGRETPDAVVFGSSRAFTYRPAHVAALWNETAYNWAVPEGGNLGDLLLLLDWWAREDKVPQHLMVSYDLRRAVATSEAKLQESRAYEGVTGRSPPLEQRLGQLRQLFAWTTIQDSGRAVAHAWAGTEPAIHLYEDGHLDWLARANAVESGTWDQSAAIDKHWAQFIEPAFDPPRGLAPTSMDRLDAVVTWAQAHGVMLDLWLAPAHPTVLDRLAATDFPEVYAAWLAHAGTHCGPDVDIHDTLDIVGLGGDARWFYDGNHFAPPLADEVLDHVHAGSRSIC